MYLDLMDALRASGNVVQKAIQIAPEEMEETGVVSTVQGVVRAQNARRHLVVSGAASARLEMQCARCLRPFEQAMDVELEVVAPMALFAEVIQVEAEKDDDDDATDDEELAAIFRGHSVDVNELVRQAIETQRPIAPLCSSDCPGLPEAVSYHEEIDPRWDALRRASGQAANGSGSGTPSGGA